MKYDIETEIRNHYGSKKPKDSWDYISMICRVLKSIVKYPGQLAFEKEGNLNIIKFKTKEWEGKATFGENREDLSFEARSANAFLHKAKGGYIMGVLAQDIDGVKDGFYEMVIKSDVYSSYYVYYYDMESVEYFKSLNNGELMESDNFKKVGIVPDSHDTHPGGRYNLYDTLGSVLVNNYYAMSGFNHREDGKKR